MKKEEKRGVHMIHADGQLGEVQIADEVVATIAGLAATEVEGVASMAGNITNELIGKLGVKNLLLYHTEDKNIARTAAPFGNQNSSHRQGTARKTCAHTQIP